MEGGVTLVLGSGCSGGRLRHAEIHLCRLCCPEVPVGAGTLYLIKGFPEHGIVRFFPIQQKIDGFSNLFVRNLTVQVFIDDLCPLFRCNIGQQIGAEIPGYRDIITSPGIARKH